jgi:hypothetical protein
MSLKTLSATLTVLLLLLGNNKTLRAGQNVVVPVARAARVTELVGSVRWRTADERREYDATKDALTNQLLQEIDGIMVASVAPQSMNLGQVRISLDALLGHAPKSLRGSLVFDVTLPNGHFLLIGVEIPRGGGTIPEDAISFRAYKDVGERFALVSNIEFLHQDIWHDGSAPLSSMNARALTRQPIGTQFRFLAWANLPSGASPPTVAVRLFGFDGDQFVVTWQRDDFMSPFPTDAVTVTADGGFIISRMPDPRGTRVVNESYAVTADGPQKVTESETFLR